MIPNYNPYQTAVPQQPRFQFQDPNFLKGRPVTSIEEVRATPIDFDGSIFYFPDLTNNRIYTKQINMDGTPLFKVYELKALPLEPQIPTGNFVTREEFEQVITQLKTMLTPPPQSSPVDNIIAQF
ncbi:MAG: hypothetical protein E7270_01200 [Lachnospiraceae bacterium]|nr:hypothetical protein [Lachnospiraceae bacterium]